MLNLVDDVWTAEFVHKVSAGVGERILIYVCRDYALAIYESTSIFPARLTTTVA